MTSKLCRPTVYSGTLIHCKSIKELDVLEHALVGVDGQGVIRFVEKDTHLNGKSVRDIAHGWGWDVQDGEWDLVELERDSRSWYFPGFIGMWIILSSLMS